MPADALIGLLPDLVVLMRRDGRVLALGGGLSVPDLKPAGDAAGEGAEPAWSDATRTLVIQLVRRSISLRTTTDTRFREADRHYEARATAQGPDRATRCSQLMHRTASRRPCRSTTLRLPAAS